MRIVSSEVPLYDNREKTMVMAALIENIEQERIKETGLEWKRRRREISEKKFFVGLPVPEHFHWDWGRKLDEAGTSFAIEYHGEIQGLMLVDTVSYLTRLFPDWDKPILYISYIENAPHNIYDKQFFGIGEQLYRFAIYHSIKTGSEGRVGLHSLPQAEDFYEEKCGMTRMRADSSYQNLVYFESTKIQSQVFLKRKQ